MNIDICKKCRRYVGIASLTYDREGCVAGNMIVCCSLNNKCGTQMNFYEKDLERLRDVMDGKRYCNRRDEEWTDIVNNFSDEYAMLEDEIKKMQVPDECEYYVEQTLDELNN